MFVDYLVVPAAACALGYQRKPFQCILCALPIVICI